MKEIQFMFVNFVMHLCGFLRVSKKEDARIRPPSMAVNVVHNICLVDARSQPPIAVCASSIAVLSPTTANVASISVPVVLKSAIQTAKNVAL